MKNFRNYLKIFAIALLIALGCDRRQKDDINKNKPAQIKWNDVKDWAEHSHVSSGFDDKIRIRYDAERRKWVLVFIDREVEPEDTTIFGPFSGHPPFDYEIEFFENDTGDEDDEWVIEYACDKGCCIQVYGKVNGKIILKKTYTIPGHNCQHTVVDSADGEKTLYATTFGSDTVSALRINYHTGDSIFLVSTPDSLNGLKDLEVIGNKIITIRNENDTNYITIRSLDGQFIDQIKMPGKFVKVKDDRRASKIVITQIGNNTKSRVLLFSQTGISAGPDINQAGTLVDLQIHRINNQTYYIVTTYDATVDATNITIIGPDGQGMSNHSLKGKFFAAKKISNSNKKIFITSDPANNDGSGVTQIGVYDIQTGVGSNTIPPNLGGKPTDLNVAGDGSVTVTTQDASGASSSQAVLIN